jgi:hypothetical protein
VFGSLPACKDLMEKLLVAGDGSLPPRLFNRVALHLPKQNGVHFKSSQTVQSGGAPSTQTK